jgi:hypothetical protein
MLSVNMQTFLFFFGVCVLFVPLAHAQKSMETSDDLRQSATDIPRECSQQLLNAQKEIFKLMDQKSFYEYIEVEYHPNCAVKKITKGTHWQAMVGLGLAFGVGIGPTVYFIGPQNVLNFAKLVMQSKGIEILTAAPI